MEAHEQTTKLAPACREVAELMAAGALGTALPAREQARLNTHLAGCAECRRRQTDYATVTDALLLQIPLVAPPAALRERIVTNMQQRNAAARPRQDVPVRRRPWFTWQRALTPAFGLLAALLLGWGLGLYVQLRQQYALADQQSAQIVQQQAQIAQQQEQAARNRAVAVAAFGNADAQERRLTPSATAPAAEGRVLISPGAPAMALYVKNLPPLAADQVYHVWWEHNGQTVQLGTFKVDPQGRAWSLIQPPAPLATPGRLIVSAAPSDAQAMPTDRVYLSAEF